MISFNVERNEDGHATGKVNLIDESNGSDAGYFIMDKAQVRMKLQDALCSVEVRLMCHVNPKKGYAFV